VIFQLVVTGHFVALAVFLLEAQPPAPLLRIVMLDGERDDGADAGEGVGHHGKDGAIPQPHHGGHVMPASSAVASSEDSTGVPCHFLNGPVMTRNPTIGAGKCPAAPYELDEWASRR
jgi:hypothetical protein